jgi:hydroxymethylpyrimidine pyrophosphatase-like HAD family hydrolase
MRRLIAELDEAGVPQVLASGKQHEYLGGMARGLGLGTTGWVIGENGATIYDWSRLLFEIEGDHLEDVKVLRKLLWEGVLSETEYYEEPKFASITIFPRDRDLRKSQHVLELIQGICAERKLQLAPEVHPDSAVDILQVGVNKGRAVRAVAEKLGLEPESLAAFGEGINDVGMMELCYPVAPADAHPAVKELVERKQGYLATQPGPLGVLEGFWFLRSRGLTSFELPAWLEECRPVGETP